MEVACSYISIFLYDHFCTTKSVLKTIVSGQEEASLKVQADYGYFVKHKSGIKTLVSPLNSLNDLVHISRR